MLSDDDIRKQLDFVLDEASFPFLGKAYQGKVRDSYTKGDVRFLITSDRLSCFDRVVATVPFKGEALNRTALHWFSLSKGIIHNHLIDSPDPNVMVARECEIVPIEVVVRAYLAGSAGRDYAAGKKVSGVSFPAGMKTNQKLPKPTLTPSTKAPKGEHDEPISEEEILNRKLVAPEIWQRISNAALELFALGERESAKRGLILVDTKYEFGLLKGEVILADEIHTMDSSRYWIAADYEERFSRGEQPQMLDKEPTRQWLLGQGFKGDGPVPVFTDEHRIELAKHYMHSFELITGQVFPGKVGSVKERINNSLKDY